MSKLESKVIVASDELNDAVRQLKELRRQMKVMEAQEKKLREQICKYMGETEELVDQDGLVAITWIKIKDTMRLDVDTLKLMYPQAYNDCLTQVSGVRRFLVK